MGAKCPCKRKAITSKEAEGEGSRERFEDDPLLPLEMEKGANSQGMQGIYYI